MPDASKPEQQQYLFAYTGTRTDTVHALQAKYAPTYVALIMYATTLFLYGEGGPAWDSNSLAAPSLANSQWQPPNSQLYGAVTIKNESFQTVKLVERYWEVTNARGQTHEERFAVGWS